MPMKNPSTTYLKNLHELLDQHFNLEEIRTLCFELHVDYDNLQGEGKSAKIRELILGLSRKDRLPDLAVLAHEKRSNVGWPIMPHAFELPDSLEWAVTSQTAQNIIQGDFVQGDKISGSKITVGNISNSQGVAIGSNASAKVTIQQELTEDNLGDLFAPLLEHVALNTPSTHRVTALKKVALLEKELEKGVNAKDETVASLIENLVALLPTVIDPIVVLFANSIIVSRIGSVTIYVLKQIEN